MTEKAPGTTENPSERQSELGDAELENVSGGAGGTALQFEIQMAEQGERIEVDGDGAVSEVRGGRSRRSGPAGARPLTAARARAASAGSRSANSSTTAPSSPPSSITPRRARKPSTRTRTTCKRSATSALVSAGRGWKTSRLVSSGANTPSSRSACRCG